MSENAPKRRGGRKRPASDEYLPSAVFKARCLELVNRVRETGVEYVVTKHGRPMARLVPYQSAHSVSSFGSMKGTVLKYNRPFDPIDGEYDIDRR